MKIAELRQLSSEALAAEITKTQAEVGELQLAGVAASATDDVHARRKLRRQIARAKTLLREKELA